MRSFTDALVALSLAAGLVAVPIVGVSLAKRPEAAPVISERDVSLRVAAAFNERYGALFTQSPVDGAFHALPTVAPDEFRLAQEDQQAWRLIREPLAGMSVRATVDKQTGLIAFATPSFTPESAPE